MIFKQLFRPKHQHPDPQIRIAAIQQLSVDSGDDKQCLHELAFNDSDTSVRLAALEHLGNFSLWWKLAEREQNEKVRKMAKARVESELLAENPSLLTLAEQRRYAQELTNKALLETLLLGKYKDSDDLELVASLVKRLDKPQVSRRLFESSSSVALQLLLLDNLANEANLQRFTKMDLEIEVANAVKTKLVELHTAKEKPVRIAKDTTLVLSKLLALRDCQDFQQLSSGLQQGRQAFEALTLEFSSLPAEQAAAFQQKYSSLVEQLEHKLKPLQQAYEKAKQQADAQQVWQGVIAVVEGHIKQIGAHLSNGPDKVTLGDLEALNHLLNDAEEKLQQGVNTVSEWITSARGEAETWFNRLADTRQALDNLPALQVAIEQAHALIDTFKGIVDGDQGVVPETLTTLKQQWREVSAPHQKLWPSSLQRQWQALVAQSQQAIKAEKEARRQAEKEMRRQIGQINRLIDDGKFRQSISRFQRLQSTVADPEVLGVKRQWQSLQERINGLKDWQAYVGAPKKPELLDEIQALAENPLDTEQQAKRIKQLREAWNSLVTEEDAELNEAFNRASEKAFEPCRLHYQREQAVREQNEGRKRQLLTEMQALAASDIDDLALVKALRTLQTQWRDIGHVDFQVRDELSKRYRDALAPLLARQDGFYSDNAEKKRGLITKAKTLQQETDVAAATEQAKALQQQWKRIGPAARSIDDKLWREFREANDAVFAKRQSQYEQAKSADEASKKALLDKIQGAQVVVDEAHSANALQQSWQAIDEEISQMLSAAGARVVKSVERRWADCQKAKQNRMSQFVEQAEREQYRRLFVCLGQWHNKALPEDAESLPKVWRQALSADSNGSVGQSRQQLLHWLEALSDKSSPEQEQEERRQAQLDLMSYKMEHGQLPNKDELLVDWLGHGPLSDKDVEQLPRLQALFS